ncbi:hypothetical protein D3C71_2234760 [compost metagenome]
MTCRQLVQMLQEQGAANVQAAMAEHPGQADHAQRAVTQGQAVVARQGVEIRGGGGVFHG